MLHQNAAVEGKEIAALHNGRELSRVGQHSVALWQSSLSGHRSILCSTISDRFRQQPASGASSTPHSSCNGHRSLVHRFLGVSTQCILSSSPSPPKTLCSTDGLSSRPASTVQS